VARFDHPAETTLEEVRVELMYPMAETADRFFRTRAQSLAAAPYPRAGVIVARAR
jgi:hypothetical protein